MNSRMDHHRKPWLVERIAFVMLCGQFPEVGVEYLVLALVPEPKLLFSFRRPPGAQRFPAACFASRNMGRQIEHPCPGIDDFGA